MLNSTSTSPRLLSDSSWTSSTSVSSVPSTIIFVIAGEVRPLGSVMSRHHPRVVPVLRRQTSSSVVLCLEPQTRLGRLDSRRATFPSAHPLHRLGDLDHLVQFSSQLCPLLQLQDLDHLVQSSSPLRTTIRGVPECQVQHDLRSASSFRVTESGLRPHSMGSLPSTGTSHLRLGHAGK